MSVLLLFVVGYLLGSLNFSIIFSRLFAKTDVRNHGSGNAGFTNTMRVAGKKVAVLVFICDALKAVLAILAAYLYAKYRSGDNLAAYCKYAAALGVVLGHNFPLYFGFKGGKGIVVSITIIYALNWITGCFVLGMFLIVLAITGYVSAGSLTGAATLFVTTLFMYIFNLCGVDLPQLLLMICLSFLATYMHRGNIKRLMNGTENGFKKKK